MQISLKTKKNLPYDPVILLLGIYTEKTIIQKATCTPMFTAALFTMDRTRKQPRCPLTDEWIKKVQYIYTTQYYSTIKSNEFESVTSEVDEPRPCEGSQKNKQVLQQKLTLHCKAITIQLKIN